MSHIRFEPNPLSRAAALKLVEAGAIYYSRESYHAYIYGIAMNFSPAQRGCFDVLWDNLFRGNLPVANERILRASGGATNHIFHLFKRHVAWREKVIVGDGRGNFWIRIPSEVLALLEGSPSQPLSWQPLGCISDTR